MKRLPLIIALAVAAIATAGQLRHPSNPLTLGGTQLHHDNPLPGCPPECCPKTGCP